MEKNKNTTQEAANLIASAVRDALKAVAQEAQDARRQIADDAAIAVKVLTTKNADGGSDHDILLTFRAESGKEMAAIRSDIKEIKDNTTDRINALELEKLNIKDSYPILYRTENDRINADHETRIRSNETNITRIVAIGSVLLVLLSVIEFIINKFF